MFIGFFRSLRVGILRRRGDVRQQVRARAVELGLSVLAHTKLLTAASELARNMFEHGGGGEVTLELVIGGTRKGVRITFEDRGKGIPDLQQAFGNGFTTGGGMGLGLGGARRLVPDFEITSKPGEGTKVTIMVWA